MTGSQAMPELRVRVTRRVHSEITRRSVAAGMGLAEYARSMLSLAILEPDDRLRLVETMQAEIERLRVLTDHLRGELARARRGAKVAHGDIVSLGARQ
jgi:hypothetical protein